MIAQVDQLTVGMDEVPDKVVSLPPRMCHVSAIKAQLERGKKKHPWDVLPGQAKGALRRVQQRPASFVTPLNPKTADPWSLPDVVSDLPPLALSG
jgi:hypothetical protein